MQLRTCLSECISEKTRFVEVIQSIASRSPTYLVSIVPSVLKEIPIPSRVQIEKDIQRETFLINGEEVFGQNWCFKSDVPLCVASGWFISSSLRLWTRAQAKTLRSTRFTRLYCSNCAERASANTASMNWVEIDESLRRRWSVFLSFRQIFLYDRGG